MGIAVIILILGLTLVPQSECLLDAVKNLLHDVVGLLTYLLGLLSGGKIDKKKEAELISKSTQFIKLFQSRCSTQLDTAKHEVQETIESRQNKDNERVNTLKEAVTKKCKEQIKGTLDQFTLAIEKYSTCEDSVLRKLTSNIEELSSLEAEITTKVQTRNTDDIKTFILQINTVGGRCAKLSGEIKRNLQKCLDKILKSEAILKIKSQYPDCFCKKAIKHLH